jgi:hypothetical protein
MAKRQITEQETTQYIELFLLAHRQLAAVQRQLAAGLGFWQRRAFRSRHFRIRRVFRALLQLKGAARDEAEKSIEQDLEFIGSAKKGWSYVSAGQVEYLQGLLKGLET